MSVTKVPVYRQAQIDIKEYIERHGLKPGDALPAEERFAQEIGIGRLALREALKALDSLGIVETRHGEGVFVKEFSFDSILENLPYAMCATHSQVQGLLQVRSYLEFGAVLDVVNHISADALQKLRLLADRMAAKAKAGENFGDEDRAFHAEMYRCLGNRFLDSLIDLFWEAFRRMNGSAEGAADLWVLESRAADHLQIVDMLERRDALGLLAAHRKHFQYLLTRFPRDPQDPRDPQPANPSPQRCRPCP